MRVVDCECYDGGYKCDEKGDGDVVVAVVEVVGGKGGEDGEKGGDDVDGDGHVLGCCSFVAEGGGNGWDEVA